MKSFFITTWEQFQWFVLLILACRLLSRGILEHLELCFQVRLYWYSLLFYFCMVGVCVSVLFLFMPWIVPACFDQFLLLLRLFESLKLRFLIGCVLSLQHRHFLQSTAWCNRFRLGLFLFLSSHVKVALAVHFCLGVERWAIHFLPTKTDFIQL